jgi:hypothetical protein
MLFTIGSDFSTAAKPRFKGNFWLRTQWIGKGTLSYLLHGSEKDYVTRMADCIFDPYYRLHDFGESCVQETLGWVNDEDAATATVER